ncbi:hypothetical protein [Deinococcus aerophilus]|uniref:Uncharacterized protein n=1 Tax=Deinococcus aerophilus TaxID=522488 RepID=A0ABQ2GSA2_9DEIO|nr:hypothetical protein [Deinococcus aerophilus]GGM09575.1 hypothetical protein GCM10010841_17490 [Deinococcus aerophilus]
MDDPRSWLAADWAGLLCLLLAGAGWGAQVSRGGVTWPALALTVLLGAGGLALSADASLRGHDLPLVLGLTGALGLAAAVVFGRRGE